MAKRQILSYTYYDNKPEAARQVKTSDDILAYEVGLGWYVYSKKEYANNPRKRIFGF